MRDNIDLKTILESYGEAAKQAAIDCVDRKASALAAGAKSRLEAQFPGGTGKAAASIRIVRPKRQTNKYKLKVICDAVNPAPIKNPGARGSVSTKSFASGGYPYPRVLEFSPKYGKPFFFQDYYEARAALPDEISEAIRKAGGGS